LTTFDLTTPVALLPVGYNIIHGHRLETNLYDQNCAEVKTKINNNRGKLTNWRRRDYGIITQELIIVIESWLRLNKNSCAFIVVVSMRNNPLLLFVDIRRQ